MTLRWVGRCPTCGAWNTLEERATAPRGSSRLTDVDVTPLADVPSGDEPVVASGVPEFDRVLGGGLVPGSTMLLFGEPGIGKSTLALLVLRAVAARGHEVLLVAAEESAAQVARRARRFGDVPPNLHVVATSDAAAACAVVAQRAPSVVVVDSVSALRDDAMAGAVGSVSQVRSAAEQLCATAKNVGSALILVGHVTKDGDLSGPRALEHLVDTVVRIDGDRHGALRIIRAVKHRFGSTDEVGLVEMAADGFRELPDALTQCRDGSVDVPGVTLTVTNDGSRAMVVEIQALIASSAGSPRRVAHQVSAQRLSLLLAVLEARCGVDVGSQDVFAATAGGLAANEPANDLALALAVVSVARGFVIPRSTVVIGEVDLAGAVRPVGALARRVREAARLGARTVLVPDEGACEHVAGVTLQRCRTIGDALAAVRGTVVPAAPRSSEASNRRTSDLVE